MSISKSHRLLCLFLAGLLGVCLLGFGQDFDKIPVQAVKITESIYMIVGGGGNIGVSVGPDGVLLIDSQFSELLEKIKAEIAKISSGPIRIVGNTNWHYDHVRGNGPLAKAGALIIAHEKARERMTAEQSFPELGQTSPPYTEAALPAVTFRESLTLHFNGDEVQILHLPNAHSDADLVFHFRKANVIHTGDVCFSGMYPFIDVGHGGSSAGMIAALDKIAALIDSGTKVIPGHGPLTDRKGVVAFRDMLAAVRDRVAKLIQEGKTLEQVVAAKPTADFDKSMAPAIPADMFVKIVYGDLKK
jgi:glyoxylase-like metal-dependent hydrolase (beta-lactamase superfamily II)